MKSDKKILLAFLLNLMFCIIEFIWGGFTRSIAIMSDAVHDLGDSVSIGLSYFLERVSKKEPDSIHTYGYLRYSVLGSLITSVILISGSVLVIYGGIQRLLNPVLINYDGMIILAIFGALINFLASYFTHGGHSLNQRAVSLHMLEDVLGWVVVLIGAVVMKFTDISYIDAILSIGVSIFILINALKNLNDIGDIFFEKTPKGVDIKELKEHLLSIDNVIDVHHFHIRSVDGFNNIATMHIITDKDFSLIKKKVKEELREHGINHTTIELENSDEECDDKNCSSFGEKHHHHHHH